MRKSMWAVIALSLAAPAVAQTQAEMRGSADTQYRRADAAMTAEWKATNAYMKRRDTANPSRGGGFGYAAALLNSQRAWLKFRDHQCTIEAGQYNGGTMAPVARLQCLTRLTQERSVQLRDLRWQT